MICDKWLHIYGNKLGTGVNCEWVDDVRENVRGEWLNMERIEDDKAEYITEWQQAQCSICHKWHTTPYMYFFTHDNFCPNCGADMRPRGIGKHADITIIDESVCADMRGDNHD